MIVEDKYVKVNVNDDEEGLIEYYQFVHKIYAMLDKESMQKGVFKLSFGGKFDDMYLDIILPPCYDTDFARACIWCHIQKVLIILTSSCEYCNIFGRFSYHNNTNKMKFEDFALFSMLTINLKWKE